MAYTFRRATEPMISVRNRKLKEEEKNKIQGFHNFFPCCDRRLYCKTKPRRRAGTKLLEVILILHAR